MLPEGIVSNNLSITKNNKLTQLVFNENESNKIIVWDLIHNKQKFNVSLSSSVRSLAYEKSDKYIYVSTNDSIYILDSENGNIINQKIGSNYIHKNFSPFINDSFLHIKGSELHLTNITTSENKKIHLNEVDNYPVSINYDSTSQLLFLFNIDLSINLYDKNLLFQGKISFNEYYNEVYTFENNIITYNNLGTSKIFKTYDIESLKLKHEVSIKENNDNPAYYNKSKKYIDFHQNKVFLYEENHIQIKDVTTDKIIKSIPLKTHEVHEIVLSEDKKSLLVYGIKPDVYNEREVFVYDLTNYSLKTFDNPIENQNNWSNTILFDEENFFVYRFTENQITKNSIQTGELVNSFSSLDNRKISTYPTEPILIDNKYILVILEDENYKKNIACLELKSNTLLWISEEIDNGYFSLKIEDKVITVINEGYPNNNYTVLDIETGRKIFHEKSEEKINIYPIGKDKILKISNFQGGDWKNTTYELHISEHIVSENKSTLHKVSLENSNFPNDILIVGNYLYIKFSDKLLTLSIDDLSKPIHSETIEMKDCKLIDIYDNQNLYIHNINNEKSFRAYDLKNKKQILETENFYFVSYNKPLNQILLKDNQSNLYLFNIATQKLSQTEVNLNKTNDLKIFHNRWLVYKNDKNETIFDLKNNKIKHHLDEFLDIKSLSKDGNIYCYHDKIKYSKNSSDFVSLANQITITDNASNFSFGANSDELVYFDNNRLLNILNLPKKSIKSFPLFSPSSYDTQYKKLSPNLFLASNNTDHSSYEYKIVDTNSSKTVNLSENTSRIDHFEIKNEYLFIKESNNILKIFNLNNAEQVFETTSFSHKQLHNNLVIFDDSKKIYLYSIKTNRILWESEIPRKNYKSYFSDILDNTVFVINEDAIFALDIKNGTLKSTHSLLSTVSFLYSNPIIINSETKQIHIKTGNDLTSKYQTLEFKNNKFSASDNAIKNEIDITKLKEEYNVDQDDLFSLNNSLLGVYKHHSNIFSVYDTQSKTTLFEQNIPINNSTLTWEVLENEKKIFMYNNSGNVLLIDYKSKTATEHKIDGNNFRTHNNHIYVSNYGKKVDVYELGNSEKLKNLYSLVPMSGKEYMFYTDQGYYISTKEAAKNLQFKLNEKLYSFEQFDLIYNRPDLVLKEMKSTNTDLIKMYEKAFQKRIKRQNYSISNLSGAAPTIEVINKNKLFETNKNSFTLEIKADAKTDRLSKIIIKVNDNPYKEIPTTSTSSSITENIILNKGSNSIEVYAVNSKNIRGISEKTNILYKTEEVKSPKVYFFGIGVSNYNNDKFNLKYASKDIKDMVIALTERYKNIDINLLLDKDVTIENIKKIKQKLAQTNTDDLVIISFCGHGVLDKDYNWYFATHDLDFENPEKRGFSYNELVELTNNSKSRQKLITIDACHSGEIDSEQQETDIAQDINHENDTLTDTESKIAVTKRGAIARKTTKDGGTTSFALMKQMFSELESANGTIVISASGGKEYAFEGGSYKNGVFTYSILNLLYNSVWNTLKISDLQRTVIKNVYDLTDGKQQPNVRTGTLNYDWIVW
ncbi:MAG: caspase family protein [Myroides sp.]